MDFIGSKLYFNKADLKKRSEKNTRSLSYQGLEATVVPVWILNPEWDGAKAAQFACSGWKGSAPYTPVPPTRADHPGKAKAVVRDSVP